METTFKISEAAREIGIPGIGRNKLYRILKAMKIVDRLNRPEQEYIDAKLLTRPQLGLNSNFRNIFGNVTLVVGIKGLNFIKIKALEYLENNPMPTFPRRKKINSTIITYI